MVTIFVYDANHQAINTRKIIYRRALPTLREELALHTETETNFDSIDYLH